MSMLSLPCLNIGNRIVSTKSFLLIRKINVLANATKPSMNVKQWKPPASEPGYFKYERDYSRDKRYSKPQKPGDTPSRALTRKLGHAYEVYPIFVLVGFWFIVFCYTVYISFDKIEVWLDRSHKTPPWDWERIRDNYWKKHTLVYDPKGQTHQRLEIMEKLQDVMLEAAKQRGTR